MKTAKITKKLILLSSTLTFRRCAGGYNHLFVIFIAVLDVSFAVNSCLNRSLLHLQFYYIFAVVNWHRVRVGGTEYMIPTILR